MRPRLPRHAHHHGGERELRAARTVRLPGLAGVRPALPAGTLLRRSLPALAKVAARCNRLLRRALQKRRRLRILAARRPEPRFHPRPGVPRPLLALPGNGVAQGRPADPGIPAGPEGIPPQVRPAHPRARRTDARGAGSLPDPDRPRRTGGPGGARRAGALHAALSALPATPPRTRRNPFQKRRDRPCQEAFREGGHSRPRLGQLPRQAAGLPEERAVPVAAAPDGQRRRQPGRPGDPARRRDDSRPPGAVRGGPRPLPARARHRPGKRPGPGKSRLPGPGNGEGRAGPAGRLLRLQASRGAAAGEPPRPERARRRVRLG